MGDGSADQERVTCLVPIPRLGLDAGASGIIVRSHGGGLAFDVEFLRKDGSRVGVELVSATDLKFKSTPLRTSDDYKKARVNASRLMDRSPAAGSPDYRRLETLQELIGIYESTPARSHQNS